METTLAQESPDPEGRTGLTVRHGPCSVRTMEQVMTRSGYDLEQVATERGLIAGFWFYGFFYASPAMLAERKSRMT